MNQLSGVLSVARTSLNQFEKLCEDKLSEFANSLEQNVKKCLIPVAFLPTPPAILK